MEIPAIDASFPDVFTGKVRLFPLPNLVMFPSVVQALHIFEPRYCDMLREALEGDGLITMALLKPGWELTYHGNPPISSVVCIGKIISHAPTIDGRHNILLAGLKRATIVAEESSQSTFRRASVEILEDIYPKEDALDRDGARDDMLKLLKYSSGSGMAHESLEQLYSKHVPLGVIVDIIAFTSRLPLIVKQRLLEQANVDTRCSTLVRHLRAHFDGEPLPELPDDEVDPPKRNFLPPFSDN